MGDLGADGREPNLGTFPLIQRLLAFPEHLLWTKLSVFLFNFKNFFAQTWERILYSLAPLYGVN